MLEGLLRNALQVGRGVQEIIAEDDASEALDRLGKLLIIVVVFLEVDHRGKQRWVDGLACFFPRGEFRLKFAQRLEGFVGLAESDVESDNACAVLAKIIEHAREILARKRPAAENFLRALIDIDDDD